MTKLRDISWNRLACMCAVLAGLLTGRAAASTSFPSATGETGLLDVPDAETIGLERFYVGGGARYERGRGAADTGGPGSLAIGSGIVEGFDVGFSLRQGGRPGDPVDSPALLSAVARYQLRPPGRWPGFAVDAIFDRFNAGVAPALRLLVSTDRFSMIRLTGYAGAEARGKAFADPRPVGGLAVALRAIRPIELVASATTGPRGDSVGGALRWLVTARAGLSIGISRLPRDQITIFTVGFGFVAAPREEPAASTAVTEDAAKKEAPSNAAPNSETSRTNPLLTGDRPRFPLRLRAPGDPLPTHFPGGDDPAVSSAPSPAPQQRGKP